MKTKCDIIIMIRFCFSDLGEGHSKINSQQLREQVLVTAAPLLSFLIPSCSQQEIFQAQGGLGRSWECSSTFWMGQSG